MDNDIFEKLFRLLHELVIDPNVSCAVVTASHFVFIYHGPLVCRSAFPFHGNLRPKQVLRDVRGADATAR